jgi:5-methyltetrahydropteroyltriglutamate--homocysteine methyltransferase
MEKNILFPTSVVGSLPRPKFVQDFIENNSDVFSSTVDNFVLFAIALQEQAGLDIISDGEWRRKSYIGPISDVTDCFIEYPPQKDVWRYVVEKKIEHKYPGFFAREAEFLKKHTNKKTKVSIPSPYLIGQRCWDEVESKKVYSTRREFVEAILPVLQKEILLLANTGVDAIQIDDPHICLLADENVRKTFKDPDEELRYACDLVNQLVSVIKDRNVEISLHLCRRNKGRKGWVGEGDYAPIIRELSKINVDQFALEYTIPAAGDYKVLEQLPKKFKVGLGCVDCRFEHIDTVEEIVARVEKALQYIEPSRLLLNPDCGFAPGSERLLSLDEPYLKLKNEVKAGKILRQKYTL